MVESEAKELAEEVMLGAVMFGHKHFQPVIEAIIRLAEKAAKEPRDFQPADASDVEKAVLAIAEEDLREAYKITAQAGALRRRRRRQGEGDGRRCSRRGRGEVAAREGRRRLQGRAGEDRALEHPRRPARASTAATSRPCGRSSPRSASCRAPTARRCSPAARPRRSSVATLGTGEDEQYIDALEGTCKETFLLHYNFPPYSVGETGRMGSPGRREIGHGKLAWRAIHPMLPPRARVPLHHPRRLGDHRVERLVLDGDGVRLLARADGCRRAAARARSPASPWG